MVLRIAGCNVQEAEPMEVSEAEDVWSCPTGLVPINGTPSHVDFLPALPARELKGLPDVHLAPVTMVLDKGALSAVDRNSIHQQARPKHLRSILLGSGHDQYDTLDVHMAADIWSLPRENL